MGPLASTIRRIVRSRAARVAVPPFAVLLSSGPALAVQDPVAFDRIPDAAGLSHSSVYAIHQDSRGFLWVGTADGLNRFDGYGFLTFRNDPADPRSLSSNIVWDVLEGDGGTLWIATGTGVDRFDPSDGGFDRHALPEPPVEPVRGWGRLLQDASGTLWAAAPAGLFRYAPGTSSFTRVPVSDRAAGAADRSGQPMAMALDPSGELWIVVAYSDSVADVVHLESGERLRRESSSNLLNGFLIDRDGRFWFGPQGPARLDRGSGRIHTGLDPALDLGVWAIAETDDGVLWFATSEGMYRRDPSEERATLHLMDPTSSAYLFNFGRAVHQDRAGTLWLGTHGGLFRSDPFTKRFHVLAGDPENPGRISSSAVSAVYQEPEGHLWIGTFGRGLNRVDARTGVVTRYAADPADPESLPDDVVWFLFGDSDDRLWMGSSRGLHRIDTRSGRSIGPIAAPEDGLRPFHIVEGVGGVLWTASQGVVHRYDPRTGTLDDYRHEPDGTLGPSSLGLGALLASNDGSVWIGSGTSGLDRLDPPTGRTRRFALRTADDTPVSGEGIWDIRADAEGVIWLGTGSGLGRFDPARESFRLYTEGEGLPGSVVYSIRIDRAGRLWLGTNAGLSRFDPGAAPDDRFRNFDLGDGVGSTEFNRHASFVSAAGEMFFGGMGGVTRFFPDRIRDNPLPPPVVLTSVESASEDGTRSHDPTAEAPLVVSHRENTLSFEFAALSFTNPAHNRYAYTLEGVDPGWVPAGARRFARYARIAPGEYTFRVRGSNNDGVWNTEGAAFQFTVTPPFWSTWWFRGSLLALGLGTLVAVYRYRVAQLLAVERLRLRIAGDLHDELSSGLSGIALTSDLVARDATLDEPQRARLTQVADTARTMVEDVRDMVWTVGPGKDTVEDLALKMKDVAATLLSGHEYRFDARLGPGTDALPMELRRHVLLAFKEMLHNVVRHAQATSVEIRATESGGRFELVVQDDGIGLDTSEDDPAALRNLRRRAHQMGGALEVRSHHAGGTRVELTVHIA